MRCLHFKFYASCILVTCHAAGAAVQELSGEEEEQQEADAAEHEPASSTAEIQKRARADTGVQHEDLVAVTLMKHSCTLASFFSAPCYVTWGQLLGRRGR
jgi:lipopolysaccharide export system protein LptC